MGRRDLVFKKYSFIAVRGENNEIWFAKCGNNVFFDTEKFDIQWLDHRSNETFSLKGQYFSVELDSVIKNIYPKKTKDGYFQIKASEVAKIRKTLDMINAGHSMNIYRQEYSGEPLQKRLKLEALGGGTGGESSSCGKLKKAVTFKVSPDRTSTKRKGEPSVEAPKPKAARRSTPCKKASKPKVDKSDPNWRLKPNNNVTVYEKDPLFESKAPLPYVSSSAHGKLVIRAILLDNMALLNQCIKNRNEISDINEYRSIAQTMNGMDYAIKFGNINAIRAFHQESKKRYNKPRVDQPRCLLSTANTGTYNYRSLGVRYIRTLNMSRGSKEGNNAFTKDQSRFGHKSFVEKVFCSEFPLPVMKTLINLNFLNSATVVQRVFMAVRKGAWEVAAQVMCKSFLGRNEHQFGKFFIEALTANKLELESHVRDVSMKKKAYIENRFITPIHCAAINPNKEVLEAMLRLCPDFNITDMDQRKPIHYAAACESSSTLEYLLSINANPYDTDKMGKTPLMIASEVGRHRNIEVLLNSMKKNEEILRGKTLVDSKSGIGNINVPLRNGFSPLHLAVSEGHFSCVETLLKFGAIVDKPLSTNSDKMTSLMIAAGNSDMEMVKLLIKNGAKVERTDRHRKTALFHAIINGSTSVASYLISLGADPHKEDSSGNTCLHYACAYGWYFCMKLLLDLKVKINSPNSWNTTPLAVAYMKGHDGLVNVLLDEPGANVDFADNDGKTLLLHLVSESEGINQQGFERMKIFIDVRKASCFHVDISGKNILHYLCAQDTQLKMKATAKNTWFDLQMKMVLFVLERGVSVFVEDMLKETCLSKLLSNRHPVENCKFLRRNVPLIKHLIDQHFSEQTERSEMDIFLSILLEISKKLNFNNIEEDVEIFNYLLSKVSIKTVEEPRSFTGHSALMYFCSAMKDFKIDETGDDEESIDDDSPTFSHAEIEKKWDLVKYLLIKYLSLGFRLQYSWTTFERIEGKGPKKEVLHKVSALEIVSTTCGISESRQLDVVDILLQHIPMPILNFTYVDGKSLLIALIHLNKYDIIKRILEKRNNFVNYIWEEKVRNEKTGEDEIIKTYALYESVKLSHFDITKCLLKNGANALKDQKLVGKSLLQTAIDKYGNCRSRNCFKIFKILVEAGLDVNVVDSKGRTPLHNAINSFKGDPDESLEVENFLIRNGANLFAKDARNRLPLHYVFVKIGKHNDSSEIDPIDLCKILVEAMKAKSINEKDSSDKTPLHYAAFRGAAVCCLYLLHKGACIDAKDSINNSPLSYSIIGTHSGTSLTLIQKGADISGNVTIVNKKPSKKNNNEPKAIKYCKEDWENEKGDFETDPSFEVIVKNYWHGISNIVLDKLENCGIPYSKIVETALHLQKIIFARTLVNSQSSDKKLKIPVTHKRSLIHALAYELDASHLPEMQLEFVEILVDRGIDLYQVDNFQCSPLHYACLNKNFSLCNFFIKNKGIVQNINKEDKMKRTPFSALFWNHEPFSDELSNCIKNLINASADPNVLCDYRPMSRIRSMYEPEASKLKYTDYRHSYKCTPIIVAIIHEDTQLVRCLLQNGADPNLADSDGVTPMMHAVKTNNFEMVKTVLSKQGKFVLKLSDDISSIKVPKNIDQNLNYAVKDKNGYSVLNHASMLGASPFEKVAYESIDMFRFISNVLTWVNGIHVDFKLDILNGRLLKFLKTTRIHGSTLCKEIEFEKHTVDDNVVWKNKKIFDVDIERDSQKMLQIIEEKESNDREDEEENDSLKNKHSGCIVEKGALVFDKKLSREYEALMTKIDLKSGYWGLYNYYRVELWYCEKKEVYIVFTNWGRLGDACGQYQNTPFTKLDAAIKEFCKIFKAKTGNEWEEIKKFTDISNKYRLVKAKWYKRKLLKRKMMQFDLEKSKIPSDLSNNMQFFINDISNVAMLIDDCSALGIDNNLIPFGKLSKVDIYKAESILGMIKTLLDKKERFEKQSNYKEKPLYKEYVSNIFSYSEEFYHLLPNDNFTYVSATPIDSSYQFDSAYSRVQRLLELAASEKMLLAAQLNDKLINPLDLIYKSIGCRIASLSETDEEAKYILQYMHNSPRSSKLTVTGIFKVKRELDDKKTTIMNKIGNRKLLWHGSKSGNMLGILKEGLKQKPIRNLLVGNLYGDGIYMADVFRKSFDYTHENRYDMHKSSMKQKYKYMMICEAALGKSNVIKQTYCSNGNSVKSGDSILALGSKSPDPAKDIIIETGAILPLGTLISNPLIEKTKICYWGDTYNEYVASNDNQVAVRYVVQIKDLNNNYNNDDDDDDDDDDDGDDSSDDKNKGSDDKVVENKDNDDTDEEEDDD